MKKSLFFLLVFLCQIGIAQTSAVKEAYNYLKAGDLAKAQKTIDKTIKNEESQKESKTWRFRGDIYFTLATSEDKKIQKLHDNPLQVAYESYLKAKELEHNALSDRQINQNLALLQNQAFNIGAVDFNQQQYDLAISKFQMSIKIAEHFGKTDSLALYNCGIASQRNQKYDDATTYFNQCMRMNYKAAECCTNLIKMYQDQGNIEATIAQIKECRVQYPENQSLVKKELDYYLQSGDTEKVLENLKGKIQENPNDSELQFTVGALMDQLGNREEAEKYYLESIRLNPNHFQSNYNLGTLYYNKGVAISNQSKKKKKKKKKKQTVATEIIEGDPGELFGKSLTTLEQARMIKPTDRNTLNTLMQLYLWADDHDKFLEIKAILGY